MKLIREIRINPVVPAQSVLVATARSLRPKKEEAPVPHDDRCHVDACPFCQGNEAMTPPPLLEIPGPQNWQLRIVENKYPVLDDDRLAPGFSSGLQQAIEGYGRHEVLIDHACHGVRVHAMTVEHLTLLFSTFRNRMEQLYHGDARLQFVLAFKNFGPAAGASIAHSHSQIIALPVVPENVQAEVQGSRAYYEQSGRCIFCSLIDEALTVEATVYNSESGRMERRISPGELVIERTARFIAVKPFASRYEWEVQILPLDHKADFLAAGPEDLADFAGIFRRTMARLEAALGGLQYNFFLHSLPHGAEYGSHDASYHWHLEICPRTTIPSGFELGSGLFINTIAPEEAAEKLRSIDPDQLQTVRS